MDKIKKEGGYEKDLNLSFFYEHGLQENEETLKFQKKNAIHIHSNLLQITSI